MEKNISQEVLIIYTLAELSGTTLEADEFDYEHGYEDLEQFESTSSRTHRPF